MRAAKQASCTRSVSRKCYLESLSIYQETLMPLVYAEKEQVDKSKDAYVYNCVQRTCAPFALARVSDAPVTQAHTKTPLKTFPTSSSRAWSIIFREHFLHA